jgi:hypothetical protein
VGRRKIHRYELTNITVSGYAANPDGDSYANLLEYALGLGPEASDGKTFPALTVTGGVATLIYPHLKWACGRGAFSRSFQ